MRLAIIRHRPYHRYILQNITLTPSRILVRADPADYQNYRNIWHLPNLMLLHFNELNAKLPGSMRNSAAFLDIPIDEARFADQAGHCRFGRMKSHASQTAPASGVLGMGVAIASSIKALRAAGAYTDPRRQRSL
ncbi:MAG: hypothetical protein B7Z80_09630 [Rhodospirillales bacterium 20-64-7]|nr:MAG: hypothetical protein B7Z80_09630 [Rhodospirillales bacterium 20-64-7]